MRIDVIKKAANTFLVMGVIGLGGSFAVGGLDLFFRSYLVGVVFWVMIAFGCLILQMIHTLTGGQWGKFIWKPMLSGANTFPLLFVLFLPLLGGVERIWSWTRPEAHHDPILQMKHAYLNTPFFVGRVVLFFVLWIGLATLLRKRAVAVGATATPTSEMKAIGAPGVLLMAVTGTFMATDWLMSLDPHWFSSMFPAIVMEGGLLSAAALMVFMSSALATDKSKVPADRLHDTGKMLFMFIMVWAYLSFSQYLIIYGGNVSEDVPWFVHRLDNGWHFVAKALIGLHFAVPWLLLLSRHMKRSILMMSAMSALMLFMRFVELAWFVVPNYSHHLDVVALATAFAAVLAVGGAWLMLFARNAESPDLSKVAEGGAHA